MFSEHFTPMRTNRLQMFSLAFVHGTAVVTVVVVDVEVVVEVVVVVDEDVVVVAVMIDV